MLFDGRLVETVKYTHTGTSFTNQFEILFRRAKPEVNKGTFDAKRNVDSQCRAVCLLMTVFSNGSSQLIRVLLMNYTNTCYFTIFGENITTNGTDVNKKQTRITIQRKRSLRQKYRCRQRASIRCFLHAKQLHALSFIVKGVHSIRRTTFFCRLEMPMLISTYSHNMQSYDSDNTALIVDYGTCSSDYCVFRSSSTFQRAITNNSLYFAKISTTLTFSNSPDFHFSKYVKMSKWQKIAQRFFWKLSDDRAGRLKRK